MAYVIDGDKCDAKITWLPVSGSLKTGELVELIQLVEEDDKLSREALALKDIFNDIIEEGLTYPQLGYHDESRFKSYYLSHAAFALRLANSGKVIGGFYIKPNFPGRCSHICNAGFIVDMAWRGKGAGRFMAEQYKLLAPELGYRASMFNLVFVSNQGSIHLWESLGFKKIGVVPQAGNLKGIGYQDALQFYFSFVKE
ncbi:hypothetical protein LOD99_273 [Oopsacas minuta]|uniref:N-acetyltransferase domain-containing protein n=1 Tax=Oopsacas minuta TaxID=111878 RepID=A0AAV7KBR3_9METZ|nr:hypothetical protein LOD99_273 [Oopsacas minuta]